MVMSLGKSHKYSVPANLLSVVDRLVDNQAARGAQESHSLGRLFRIPAHSRVFVLLSGGIDSAVLMFLARDCGLDVCAVEVLRATRSARERASVDMLVAAAGVDCCRIAFPEVSVRSSHTGLHGGIVSESNILYYGLAGSLAVTCGVGFVFGGTILADWQTHNAPNARPDHFDLLNELLRREHGAAAPQIVLPLLFSTKDEVVHIGLRLGVPFAETWSCSRNCTSPCGICSQCTERAIAMSLNGQTETN